MCPIFVISGHNFGRSDEKMICILKTCSKNLERTLLYAGILFDEMNCTLPPEINKPNFKGGFKEVKFENTSFSKFDVSVGSDNTITMKCHELFNSAHLK